MAESSSPTAAEPSHPVRNLAIIGMVVVVAIVVALICLYTIPVSTSFSDQFVSTFGPQVGWATLAPPARAQVHGSFYTSDGRAVVFEVIDSSNNIVYSTDSGSGSFSFTASHPPYVLTSHIDSEFGDTVHVYGHYTAPIL
jgi:hypothetical protein